MKRELEKKKAQVSLFIIVAVLALLAFAFIFFLLDEKRDSALDNARESQKTNTDASLIALKTQSEVCLDRELKRALLIAGLRGGYIYDQGETYLPGYIPDSSYSPKLVELLDLNWNNVLLRTLVHSRNQVYTPGLERAYIIPKAEGEDIVIYTRGIKEDIEHFILDQVLECLDLDILEAKGFDVERELFSGRLESFDPNSGRAHVENMRGEVGDPVLVSALRASFEGEILEVSKESVLINIEKSENFVFEEELSEVRVRNLASQANVTVHFREESTEAELSLPIRLEENSGVSTLGTVETSLSIRFKTLLDLSSTLLEEKYSDRSLDIHTSEGFEEALRRSGRTIAIDLSELTIERSIINDSDEQRKVVYSLVDDESRISGVPYSFNFGYENHAPIIDRNPGGAQVINETSLLFILSAGEIFNLNLQNVSSDREFLDNYKSFFVEQDLRTPDGDFSLARNGSLTFLGFLEKKYVHEVVVSDGETRRSHFLTFLTGFPDNANNTAAQECFSYRNFGVANLYPLNDEFRNKMYNLTREDGKEHLYALSLFIDPLKKLGPENPLREHRESQLLFSEACMFSDELYRAEVTITQRETGDSSTFDLDESTHIIPIPFSPHIQDIELTIYDEDLGTQMTEPYRVSIYPSSCLGPNQLGGEDATRLGGTLSCCDNELLRSAIASNTPRNFVSDALIQDNSVQLNAQQYFCYNHEAEADLNNAFHAEAGHEREIIWEKFGADVTSLYEGRVVGVCNGALAVPNFERVEPISSVDFDSSLEAIDGVLGDLNFSRDPSFKLTKVRNAGTCEFCALENPSGINFLVNSGEYFYSGFVSDNLGENSTVSPIPLGRAFDDILFLKEEGRFGTENILDDSSWTQSQVGRGGEEKTIFSSQAYCAQGDASATRFGSIEGERDQDPECRDWFFNGEEFDFVGNTGWSCGVGGAGVCNAGVCIESTETLRIEDLVGEELYLASTQNQILEHLEVKDASGREMCSFNRGELEDFETTTILLNFDSGILRDESSFANTILSEGSIDCTRSGVNNEACFFDRIDDVVVVESDPSFNNYPMRSFSLWLKSSGGNSHAFGQKDTGAVAGNIIYNGNLILGTYNGTSGERGDQSFSCSYPGGFDLFKDLWHHIVVVQNRDSLANSFFKVYLDGILLCEESIGIISTRINSPFFLGARTNRDSYYSGFIDEFSMYSKELNAREVEALYESRQALLYEEILPLGEKRIDVSACGLRVGEEYVVSVDVAGERITETLRMR